MNRLVDAAYREAIGAGMAIIPAAIMARLRHVHFLTGIDPVWAGLHSYTDTDDGRAYSQTAHCAYQHHTSDQTTTIVLPVPELPDVVVHELGHALDEVLGWHHAASPVTAYAATNREEAFAESFRASLYWYGDQDAFMADGATRALFAALCGPE
jgi:hypothetical protein